VKVDHDQAVGPDKFTIEVVFWTYRCVRLFTSTVKSYQFPA